jgi:hypothetical protein
MARLTGPCILYHSPYIYANEPKVKELRDKLFPDAKFVEEIVCCKSKAGNWLEKPGIVFYSENPKPPYKEKFFALQQFVDTEAGMQPNGGFLYKTAIMALPNFSPIINAIYVPNPLTGGASLAISRFGHDYYKLPHADAGIDGGRDYLRTTGNPLPTVVPYNMLTRTFTINSETYPVQPQVW